MNIHTTTSNAPASFDRNGRMARNLIAAAIGTAIAAAVITSFWPRGGDDAAAPAVQAPVQTHTNATAARPAAHTVYVVGSQAEADRISAYLSESDSARANVGEMPLHAEVMVAGAAMAPAGHRIYVVGSEAEAARIRSYIGESDAARANVGEAPTGDEVVVMGASTANGQTGNPRG